MADIFCSRTKTDLHAIITWLEKFNSDRKAEGIAIYIFSLLWREVSRFNVTAWSSCGIRSWNWKSITPHPHLQTEKGKYMHLAWKGNNILWVNCFSTLPFSHCRKSCRHAILELAHVREFSRKLLCWCFTLFLKRVRQCHDLKTKQPITLRFTC